jgi:predicted transcriptional regulator of viral defense system
MRLGVHPGTLYAMRDSGGIERLSRGLYRLSDLPHLSNPDLAIAGLRVPQGVVCLISALYHHELTTEIPRRVHLALKRGATAPRPDSPPIQVYWFSGHAFTEGVEVHQIDGVPIRIYSPEKTIADCFKYRRKLGLDTALEALRLYLGRRAANVDELMRAAAVCRAANVMRPYVEALL